jgi:CDP-diacylglycerol---glycerol-3-phosphate 3-phosphatidyltransferase
VSQSLNLPNALTIGRIFVVPVLVAVVLGDPDGSLLAAALFAAAAVTDCLDGHLARSRRLITDLGKLLDPVADKLLVGGALLALVAEERVALWVVGVVLLREVVVTALRAAAAREGHVLAAGPLGKLKMASQVVALLLLLAVPDPTAPHVLVTVYTMVGLTVLSGGEAAGAVIAARRRASLASAA